MIARGSARSPQRIPASLALRDTEAQAWRDSYDWFSADWRIAVGQPSHRLFNSIPGETAEALGVNPFTLVYRNAASLPGREIVLGPIEQRDTPFGLATERSRAHYPPHPDLAPSGDVERFRLLRRIRLTSRTGGMATDRAICQIASGNTERLRC